MRNLWWIAAIAALAAYFYILAPRAPEQEGRGVIASADLEQGRRLNASDLTVGSGPVYLQRRVPKGDAIAPADLGAWPPVRAPAGTLAVAFPARRSALGGLDAGGRAMLCPMGQAGPRRAFILAVICDDGENAQCVLIAAVPAGEAAWLAAEQRAGRRISAAAACEGR